MLRVLEANYLLPTGFFLVELGVVLLLGVGLVVVPLVQALDRGEWAWAIGVVLLAPLGGLVWFACRPRSHTAAGRSRSAARPDRR